MLLKLPPVRLVYYDPKNQQEKEIIERTLRNHKHEWLEAVVRNTPSDYSEQSLHAINWTASNMWRFHDREYRNLEIRKFVREMTEVLGTTQITDAVNYGVTNIWLFSKIKRYYGVDGEEKEAEYVRVREFFSELEEVGSRIEELRAQNKSVGMTERKRKKLEDEDDPNSFQNLRIRKKIAEKNLLMITTLLCYERIEELVVPPATHFFPR